MAAKVRVAPVWPVSPDPVRYSKGGRKAMSDNWNGVERGRGRDHFRMDDEPYCLYDDDYCYPDDLCDCCHIALGHRQVWVDKEGKEVEG